MDFTDSQLNNALQEAFTCYLAFLSHTQKLQDSKLPHRGKGVETTVDLSTQQCFQIRVAAAETCLRYTERIARRVLRWITDPDEDVTRLTEDVEYPSLNLEAFLPHSDESPFLDPLSGTWIQPITPFSAGSSGSGNEAIYAKCQGLGLLAKERNTDGGDKAQTKSTTTAVGEGVDNYPLEPKTPQDNPFSDQDFSTSSIAASTPSTTSTISSFSKSSDKSDDDNADDTMSITSEIATAFYKIPRCEVDDEAYARLLYSEEQRRACELDECLAQAQKLAAHWEQEEKSLLRDQEAYARKLERKEKEEVERIERDRQAARETDQRIKWELEAIARETEAMRAEERKRRDEAEGKKAQERERKLRIEREKMWATEMEEKQRAVREENRRQEEELLRRQREKTRKEVEKKEKTFVRKADCVSCMESGDRKGMAVLACKHVYCGNCIAALKSRSIFKCCRTPIPISHAKAHLSQSFIQKYTVMVLELNTPKPKYCSSKSCHRFIPPNDIRGPVATCPNCQTRTCVLCLKKEHSGVCKEDKEGKAVKALAEKKGWKMCPRCSQVVERTAGCLHMTCRCKAEWCYSCLRDWRVCNSTCGRE